MKTVQPRLANVQTGLKSSVSVGTWFPTGANSNSRGYTYAWRKARERFLARNPLCVKCETAGLIEAANVVDHKIPHRGDQVLFWSEENWQSLCGPCHSGAKQREEAAALLAIGR
jgi:5-methylcytosine-specific restriction endonuclease McrA